MDSTNSYEGLPNQFVSYLKVLFDILDDKKSGYVPLADITSRWQDDVEGLPKGVMGDLSKMTFPDGRLSFDRFLGGIKMALMRRNKDRSPVKPAKPQRTFEFAPNEFDKGRAIVSPGRSRSPGPDLIPQRHTSPSKQRSVSATRNQPNQYSNNYTTDHVFKANKNEYSKEQFPRKTPSTMSQQRTFSMPQLDVEEDKSNVYQQQNRSFSPNNPTNKENVGVNQWRPGYQGPGVQRDNWWANDARASVASMSALDRYGERRDPGRGSGGGSGESDRITGDDGAAAGQRRRFVRRHEGRRHTVSSGIDFQMVHSSGRMDTFDRRAIKRMKQLEQEKDVLLQGLDMINRGRDWYQGQIREVQDKQKSLASAQHQDYSLDSHQERVNLMTARISELNQQVNILIDSSKKGFPMHMHLAVSTPTKSPLRPAPSAETDKQLMEQSNVINLLKSQNKQLNQEVGQKSERIGQLEHEKAQLIREMFQATSRQRKVNYEDSSYI